MARCGCLRRRAVYLHLVIVGLGARRSPLLGQIQEGSALRPTGAHGRTMMSQVFGYNGGSKLFFVNGTPELSAVLSDPVEIGSCLLDLLMLLQTLRTRAATHAIQAICEPEQPPEVGSAEFVCWSDFAVAA